MYLCTHMYECLRVQIYSAETRDIALNENEWIKLNHDHTGYYRVNYSPELWQLLINQLYTDHRVRIHQCFIYTVWLV